MTELHGITVIKLGGSVFELPGWFQAVHRLLERKGYPQPLIVVGGGAAADLVREWDAAIGLGDEASHRLAIAAMQFNARFAVEVLGNKQGRDARLVAPWTLEAAWRAGAVPIADPVAFLNDVSDAAPPPLPASWNVTSDAIAGWIARAIGAEKLVLVKSIGRPAATLEEIAQLGAIDPVLPRVAAGLHWEWINLRDESRTSDGL